MAESKPFNLFIYGTLMNPSVFRAVLGRELVFEPDRADNKEYFLSRQAVLNGYEKVSPDNTYLYAVPDPHGRIRGYIVGPLPGECLNFLREYEGKNYSRKRLNVQTADGMESAVVFVGNLKKLKHSFGYQFHDELKQEIILSRKIETILAEAEQEHLKTSELLVRRAMGELHGDVIRDLVREHFESGGISDYAIRESLKNAPVRDFNRITADSKARALAPNYLSMVIRQVIFNQLEEKVRNDFRYELDHMDLDEDYYDRTISSLATLRMLNANASVLDSLVGNCLKELHFDSNRLLDFVRWSIAAADSIYDHAWAKSQIAFIHTHMGHGYVHLGAELEFSNIGHAVISDPKGESICDLGYDSFFYFSDFGLDALTWKLGGHVDDHYLKASRKPRRGFFEIALGSLSIEANISKPVTNDPWLLNQFIHEARKFYKIAPHSVHISLQLRSQHKPSLDRMLPIGHMKCLFAIAGDLSRGDDNAWRIKRLASDEIIRANPNMHMLFSEISQKRSSNADDSQLAVPNRHTKAKYIQQFKFLRLSPEINYEPVVMALKGLQIILRPGSFMTPNQYLKSRKHRDAFEEIIEWGRHPAPLGSDETEKFVEDIYEGLLTEHRGKPAHNEAYILWSLNQLRRMLKEFNEKISS